MNNAIMIIKNLPMLLKSGKLVSLFVFTVGLSLGAFYLFYAFMDSQAKAEAVGKELSMISSYMQSYKKKDENLKSISERPIAAKDLDATQTEILLLMQSTEVKIIDLKTVKDGGTKESQSVVYKPNENKTAGEKEAAKAAKQDPNAGNVAQKAVKKQSESPHRAYDVKLQGRYENLMTFVQRFGAKNKLVTIRKFALSPLDNDLYVADIRYKIYVK
ncbi:MAG: hypothetical protein IKN43_07455 [Selenomonadaceae bacterium]|nr:hypothetical protein [Selenomonadaceae bacterium]